MKFTYSGKRVLSIDVFRGFTILVMIWVNELAGISNIAPWLKHMAADADAMSFVDIVFPGFLFIVGMSIPFAIQVRLNRGATPLELGLHITMRFLGLIVLGLFMMNTETGFDQTRMGMSISLWGLFSFMFAILVWNAYPVKLDKRITISLKTTGWIGLLILFLTYKTPDGEGMQIHWWGILGLIGWAYLIAIGIYLISKAQVLTIGVSIGFITVFYALFKGSLLPGNALIDFLGGQLGHLIHTSIVLSGTVVSLLLFNENKPIGLSRRLINLALFMVLIVVSAIALRPYFSISKIWATPSWAFFSIAICTTIFLAIYYMVEVKTISQGLKWLTPAASNPLLIYILPYIIAHISTLTGLRLVPSMATQGIPGIIWTMAYAILMIAIVRWLNKFHLRLRL